MKISATGELTIPERIRAQVGITAETELEIVVEGNTIVIVRAPAQPEGSRGAAVLGRLRGRATAGLATDTILGHTREP